MSLDDHFTVRLAYDKQLSNFWPVALPASNPLLPYLMFPIFSRPWAVSLSAAALATAWTATSCLAATDVKLSMGEKGVNIVAGNFSNYTLLVPTMNGGTKPVYTLADGVGTATYPDGTELELKLEEDKGQVIGRWTGAKPTTKNLRFEIHLPTKFGDGGQFSFNGGALQPFPAEHKGQFIAKGDGNKVAIIDPLGEGFALETPGGWHVIQDNREWGWAMISYQSQFDIAGRPEGYFSYKIKGWGDESSPDASSATAGGEKPAQKFLVDKFGQSARKDYPNKVKSIEELKADVAKEREANQAMAATGPKLDKFGGLAGSGEQYGLKKTGFFHIGEVQGRQVLVTPEGNMFFHISVTTLGSVDDYTTVKGRENHYEELPSKTGEFATAWRPNDNGVYSFYIGNWIRKHGQPYEREAWLRDSITRLKSWGFNSAGAFTALSDTFKELNFPYTRHLGVDGGEAKALPDKLGAGHALDPFTPGIADILDKKFAASLSKHVDDPYTIGYFLGNEQHFEMIPKLVPTYKASKVAAKAKLVELLKDKYKNIDAFNKAWNPAKPFASFKDLEEEPLFVRTDKGAADMQSYFELFMETYYSLVETAFRKHDKNHLLIGNRWTPGTSTNETVVRAGGRHLDVLSINYYSYPMEKDFLTRAHEWGGKKPIILSEWHYCSSDEGLQARMEVKTQEDRGAGYRNYIEQSAALPFVVGSEWFSFIDQSITGRFFEGFNGEGYNIGFVNVADRPYKPLVAAAKASHDQLYDVMLGKVNPYVFDDARFNPKEGAKALRTVAISKALPGLKLDGTTTNWPGRPAEPIENSRLAQGNPNPNLRGDFRLCWDKDTLYFLIQVKDATPMMSNKTGKSIWSADAVELFIGWQKPEQGGTMIYSDRQILMAAKPDPELYIVDHPEDGAKCQILVEKSVSGDGYVLEAAIPFSVLGIDPKPEMELLFDVAIDNSDDSSSRAQQLTWNGNSKNSGDRAAWGRAKLVEN